eukprot:757854-Hanusia_phi.AAC.2
MELAGGAEEEGEDVRRGRGGTETGKRGGGGGGGGGGSKPLSKSLYVPARSSAREQLGRDVTRLVQLLSPLLRRCPQSCHGDVDARRVVGNFMQGLRVAEERDTRRGTEEWGADGDCRRGRGVELMKWRSTTREEGRRRRSTRVCGEGEVERAGPQRALRRGWGKASHCRPGN